MKNKIKELWNRKKKVAWVHLTAYGILVVEYLLCRFAFFDLHGMKEWPLDLLIFGTAVMLISLIAQKKQFPFFLSAGYMVGFICGMLFQTQGVDLGGGKTNNDWIIWTGVYLGFILAGIVWETAVKWWNLLKKKS